ncbi:TraI/MobA(P) family conjugative relaxase [Candidatus Erwinia dacicola]|uniref:MobA/VirD2-like nuclease domain-containing protein n=4 Tax=Candidatus Erwinia dacicola TaxID=252393 RepID=A0A1E7YVD2_9GAMM|nr:TraI/MobA(P) family conjugative relaxase [Candidatus Erwinia dacicola]OFC58713.1 hypothetical protein BBW68_02805 [Candidatus Erwinia dacicola]
MIPKIIPRPKKGTGFSSLVSYIAQKSPVQWDKPIEQATASEGFEALTGYLKRHEESISPAYLDEFDHTRVDINGISILHNCLSVETAAREMEATANVNVACKDSVFHYVLSWQENETPSDAQVFDSVRFTLQSMGLQEHQFVAAIHRDTDNLHVHVAVNRVHPITFRANHLSYSIDTLHKASRLLEIKHGFNHDNGLYTVNENGYVLRQKDHHRNGLSSQAEHKVCLMENKSGRPSLYHYLLKMHHENRTVADELKSEMQFKTSSWRDVHALFARAGFSVSQSPHAGGLLITHGAGDDQVSVCWRKIFPEYRFSYDALIARIGSFQPGNVEPYSVPEIGMGYSDSLSLREINNRVSQCNERAIARMDLKGQYKAYTMALPVYRPDRSLLTQQYRQVNAHLQMVKASIRESERDPQIRRILFNAAEFDKRKAIAYIKARERESQQSFKAAQPRLNYKDWVAQQALSCDKAALSQLRSWAYRETRKKKYQNAIIERIGHDNLSNFITSNRDDVPVTKTKSFTTSLLREGTVIYRDKATDDIAMVDRGRSVCVGVNSQDNDHHQKAAATLVLTGKPSEVGVYGKDEFTQKGIRTLSDYIRTYPVYSGIRIKNSDDANAPFPLETQQNRGGLCRQ